MEPNKLVTLVGAFRIWSDALWNVIGMLSLAIFIIVFPVGWLLTGSASKAAAISAAAIAPSVLYNIWLIYPPRHQFGIAWDRKGRPRCPRCFSLVMGMPGISVRQGGPAQRYLRRMRCHACSVDYVLHDADGRVVDFLDAQQRVMAENRSASERGGDGR